MLPVRRRRRQRRPPLRRSKSYLHGCTTTNYSHNNKVSTITHSHKHIQYQSIYFLPQRCGTKCNTNQTNNQTRKHTNTTNTYNTHIHTSNQALKRKLSEYIRYLCDCFSWQCDCCMVVPFPPSPFLSLKITTYRVGDEHEGGERRGLHRAHHQHRRWCHHPPHTHHTPHPPRHHETHRRR